MAPESDLMMTLMYTMKSKSVTRQASTTGINSLTHLGVDSIGTRASILVSLLLTPRLFLDPFPGSPVSSVVAFRFG